MLMWIRINPTRSCAATEGATGSVARVLRPGLALKQRGYAPWVTPSCSSAIPTLARRAHTTPRLAALMASGVICACLALPGKTQAEETAAATTSHAITSQTSAANPGRSEALLRVIALRLDLEAQVKALSRLVAYQKELLDLANTRDREAVLRARRQRQSCLEDISAAALCDALRVSFSDDRADETTRQDVGQDVGQDRGAE